MPGGGGGQGSAAPQQTTFTPGGISGSSNPANFDSSTFAKTIGAGMENAFAQGNQVFDKSLYAGQGTQTKSALDTIWNTASGATGMFDGSVDLAKGLVDGARNPSLTEEQLLATAKGANLNGANPFFEANLKKVSDSTYADVMASLGGTGRVGSTVHMDELTGALGNVNNTARMGQYETERDRQIQALAVIEGQRQLGVSNGMAGAAALPGLYAAKQLPGQTMLQVGQMRDTDAQAQLMADYDLFQRRDPYSHLSKYSALLNGSQNTAGFAPPAAETPWWQTAGQIAVGLL